LGSLLWIERKEDHPPKRKMIILGGLFSELIRYFLEPFEGVFALFNVILGRLI